MATQKSNTEQRRGSGHPTRIAPVDAEDRANKFTPVQRMVSQTWKRNAGYVLALLVLLFASWQMARMAEAQNRLGYEFVVGDGSFTWGKLRRMGPGAESYKRFLSEVVRMRLHLTPQGLKYPDEAAAVFVGDARARLEAELGQWVAKASRLNMFADPYLAKIEPLPPHGDNPVFRLSGKAKVTGMAGSMPIMDEEPWFMSLELATNPKINLDERADSPFVVLNYSLVFGKQEIERARRAKE